MKQKVITFAADCNTVVAKYMELKKIADGVYTSPVDSVFPDTIVSLVIEVNGVFFTEGNYSESTLLNGLDRVTGYVSTLPAAWYSEAEQGAWINLVKLRVLSELGMDTAPIMESRERYRAAQQKENEEKLAAREEARRLAHEAEIERLNRQLKSLKDGEFIRASDFVDLLHLKSVKVHPRTMGVINKLADKRSEIAARSIKPGYKVATNSLNGVWPVIEQLIATA